VGVRTPTMCTSGVLFRTGLLNLASKSRRSRVVRPTSPGELYHGRPGYGRPWFDLAYLISTRATLVRGSTLAHTLVLDGRDVASLSAAELVEERVERTSSNLPPSPLPREERARCHGPKCCNRRIRNVSSRGSTMHPVRPGGTLTTDSWSPLAHFLAFAWQGPRRATSALVHCG